MTRLQTAMILLLISAAIASAQKAKGPGGNVPEVSTQFGAGALAFVAGGVLILKSRNTRK